SIIGAGGSKFITATAVNLPAVSNVPSNLAISVGPGAGSEVLFFNNVNVSGSVTYTDYATGSTVFNAGPSGNTSPNTWGSLTLNDGAPNARGKQTGGGGLTALVSDINIANGQGGGDLTVNVSPASRGRTFENVSFTDMNVAGDASFTRGPGSGITALTLS